MTFVYLLIDPRDGEVIYIGISLDPRRRLKQHRTDQKSAVYLDLVEMGVSDIDPILSIAAAFSDRRAARIHESKLISLFSNSKNRTRGS